MKRSEIRNQRTVTSRLRDKGGMTPDRIRSLQRTLLRSFSLSSCNTTFFYHHVQNIIPAPRRSVRIFFR